MQDELAKLDSLRQQGILTEDAYWEARSRLHAPLPATQTIPLVYPPKYGPAVGPEPTYDLAARPSPIPRSEGTRSSRHQHKRRRRAPVVALAAGFAIMLAAAGTGSYFLWFRDTNVTVAATYVLDDNATANADCDGQGSNSSIAAGADVRLVDGKGKELARAKLPAGTSNAGKCTFIFRFPSVADEIDSYSLIVPGFPRKTMSHNELKSNGWKFSVKQDPPTGSVTGTLQLSDFDTVANDCVGTGGYDDIVEGAEVVIRDQDHRILGSGYLDAGTSSDYSTCTYPFTVDDIRQDQEQYTVEVSHRGEITASRDELENRDWRFSATLGS